MLLPAPSASVAAAQQCILADAFSPSLCTHQGCQQCVPVPAECAIHGQEVTACWGQPPAPLASQSSDRSLVPGQQPACPRSQGRTQNSSTFIAGLHLNFSPSQDFWLLLLPQSRPGTAEPALSPSPHPHAGHSASCSHSQPRALLWGEQRAKPQTSNPSNSMIHTESFRSLCSSSLLSHSSPSPHITDLLPSHIPHSAPSYTSLQLHNKFIRLRDLTHSQLCVNDKQQIPQSCKRHFHHRGWWSNMDRVRLAALYVSKSSISGALPLPNHICSKFFLPLWIYNSEINKKQSILYINSCPRSRLGNCHKTVLEEKKLFCVSENFPRENEPCSQQLL